MLSSLYLPQTFFMKLTIKQKFGVLLLGNVLLGLLALAIVISTLNNLTFELGNYFNNSSQRSQLLLDIKSKMGYGSGIHSFKNYILRGDEKYYNKTKDAYSKVNSSIHQLKKLKGKTIEELIAFGDIQSIANQYHTSTDLIKNLINNGKSAKEIDEVININDKPAIEALVALDQVFQRLTEHQISAFEERIKNTVTLISSIVATAILIISGISWFLFRKKITVSHIDSQQLNTNENREVKFSDDLEGHTNNLKNANTLVDKNSQTSSGTAFQHQEPEQAISLVKDVSASTTTTTPEHFNNTAQKLANDSQQIDSVLEVIKNITEQTNLLALNAATEAVLAGEPGRNFSLITDEVRALAHHTQQSIEEIRAMIEKLQLNKNINPVVSV